MKVLVIILEILGGLAAIFALVAGIQWAKQDHADTTQRESSMDSLRTDISNLETQAKEAEDWLRTPTTDVTTVKDEKRAEMYSHRESLAAARTKLKAMEGSVQGVPVALSQTAFERAKRAGILGMAAIVFGAAAGVLGVFVS